MSEESFPCSVSDEPFPLGLDGVENWADRSFAIPPELLAKRREEKLKEAQAQGVDETSQETVAHRLGRKTDLAVSDAIYRRLLKIGKTTEGLCQVVLLRNEGTRQQVTLSRELLGMRGKDPKAFPHESAPVYTITYPTESDLEDMLSEAA